MMRKLVLTHLRHQFVEAVRTVAPLLTAMLITYCMTAIANDEGHPLKKLRPRLILK
jgi:Na+/serine symporter